MRWSVVKIVFIILLITFLLSACTQKEEVDDSEPEVIEQVEKAEEEVINQVDNDDEVQVDIEPQLYYIKDDDLYITKDGAQVEGLDIAGNVYVEASVGDGEFHIENCNIAGDIYVYGGGPNSGYLINVVGRELYIQSETNPKLVLGLNTRMEGVQIASDCSLYTDGNGVNQVKINDNQTQEAINVLLDGEYPEVSIESTANVMINGTVSLMRILSNAGLTDIEMINDSAMYFFACDGESVTVHGGTIIEAWINAEYCSLPEDTEKIDSEVGIADVKVGDVEVQIIPRESETDTENPTEMAEAEETETKETSEPDQETNADNEDSADNQRDETDQSETDKEDSAKDQPDDSTEEERDDTADENTDETENIETEEVDLTVDAGAPTLTRQGQNIIIHVSVNEICTLYVLVESPDVLAMGSRPENVRDGISAGAGMIMPDGMEYMVIHRIFQATQIASELSFSITMEGMGLGGDMPDGDIPDDIMSPGVLVVIEDAHGNLSQVYVLE